MAISACLRSVGLKGQADGDKTKSRKAEWEKLN